jgi:hypothetical protein
MLTPSGVPWGCFGGFLRTFRLMFFNAPGVRSFFFALFSFPV